MMRILVVEDEWVIACDVAAALVRMGHEVVGPAGSIRIALKILSETKCDATILDINLAGTSAEPIAEDLRKRGIPFLVVSGYATDQRSGALAEAPFLAKPYDTAKLADMINVLQQSI
jgi:DNA-binding response OmpR family regulator